MLHHQTVQFCESFSFADKITSSINSAASNTAIECAIAGRPARSRTSYRIPCALLPPATMMAVTMGRIVRNVRKRYDVKS